MHKTNTPGQSVYCTVEDSKSKLILAGMVATLPAQDDAEPAPKRLCASLI